MQLSLSSYFSIGDSRYSYKYSLYSSYSMNSDFLKWKISDLLGPLSPDMYGRGPRFIVDVLRDTGFMSDRCINGS